MHLKLEDPKFFSNLIGVISDLVTEVRIKVNKEGMSLTALDPASVAMVYFNIPADLFATFEIDQEEILGINLENLKAVLRRCGLGSSLTLRREDNLLKLEIQDKIRRDFTLALINVEGEERELPNWEFSSVIKMDSETFVEIIEDCMIVGDACTFVAEPNKFIIEAKGLNSARAEFSSDEVEIYSHSSIARYSLEYLGKFSKGAKLASKAAINFSSDHPMRINFQSGKIMLSFVLAPRMEQED